MVQLAAGQQVRVERHIGYLGTDPASIAADVAGVDGWTARTAVAVDGAGRLAGWLLAETDDEMGRVWWWGPFAVDEDWAPTADALYGAAAVLTAATEEELAPDERHRLAAEFADRHGFRPETASAVLSYRGEGFGGAGGARPLDVELRRPVVALHDVLFPGTHTTGEALVRSDDVRLVLSEHGALAGYVAAEVHTDGSGYIDFLGVDPAARGRGIGRRLVEGAVDALLARGVTSVNLTVRESNGAARALYDSLGFTEERLIRPYRKNFILEPVF